MMAIPSLRPLVTACLAAVCVAAMGPARAAATGIPVVDGQSIAQSMTNHLEEIAKFVEQIAVLRDQLESARRQYDSITGVRGFGDLMSNPAIRRSLPDDVQKLYRRAENSYDGLSRSIDRIRGEERLSGRYSLDRQGLLQRIQEYAEMAKALGERAYEGLDVRQQQIDDLQRQINMTQDPKAISELQARLAVEGGSVEVDGLRLLLMRQQADAERVLISQQENALAQQAWFDTGSLRGMSSAE